MVRLFGSVLQSAFEWLLLGKHLLVTSPNKYFNYVSCLSPIRTLNCFYEAKKTNLERFYEHPVGTFCQSWCVKVSCSLNRVCLAASTLCWKALEEEPWDRGCFGSLQKQQAPSFRWMLLCCLLLPAVKNDFHSTAALN